MADRTAQPPAGTGIHSRYTGARFGWNAVEPNVNALTAAAGSGAKGTSTAGADGTFQKYNNTDGATTFSSITVPTGAYTLVMVEAFPAASIGSGQPIFSTPSGGMRCEHYTSGGGVYHSLIHTSVGSFSDQMGVGYTHDTEAWTYVVRYDGTTAYVYMKMPNGTEDTASQALGYAVGSANSVALGNPSNAATGGGLYAVMLVNGDLGDTEANLLLDNPWRMFAEEAVVPVISSPTAGTPGSTSIAIGFTTDTLSDGTAKFLRRVGGSAASAATIASTGESQATTGSNPQSRTMTGFTASSTNNYVDMIQAGAAGNSNVLSVGPFTMAALPPPTIGTQPTAQAANEGSTAEFTVAATGTGTLTYQWKRQPPAGGAFSNVGTNSASYTTSALDCATDHGAQFKCDVTDDNGTTTSSTVGLTVYSTATTSRPDLDVTTTGWTASTGSDFYALIDETTASTTDYVTSPDIDGTPVYCTYRLKYPLATGDQTINIHAKQNEAGAVSMRVRLLDASGTVVGTSADIGVTESWASYAVAITTSAPAFRVQHAFIA